MPDQSPSPGPTVFDSRTLAVGQGHSLYLEQSGDPAGLPALYLHGGPGSGCQASHHKLFDPRRHRAVLFDQRGAGKSTPKGSLEANTTGHLVADIERLREALDVERWLLVGGSWGSLLALAYALAHPGRVSGLVLRAPFLGSPSEVEWAFREGPRAFRPELWRAFLAPLPEAERADPIAAYGRRLEGDDPVQRRGAARIWLAYEQALSSLQPRNPALPASIEEAGRGTGWEPATPSFEWHYIRHGFFLDEGPLLERCAALGDMPGIVVQGRYDLLCPPKTGLSLAQRWPGGHLRIVEEAGHSLEDPGVREAVMEAIAGMTPAG